MPLDSTTYIPEPARRETSADEQKVVIEPADEEAAWGETGA